MRNPGGLKTRIGFVVDCSPSRGKVCFMGKDIKAVAGPGSLDSLRSLGLSYDGTEVRHELADWLIDTENQNKDQNWYGIYKPLFNDLRGTDWGKTLRAMETDVNKLARDLCNRSPLKQLELLNAVAQKHGLQFTPGELEKHFRKQLLSLTLGGPPNPRFKNLYEATRLCNSRQVKEYNQATSIEVLANKFYQSPKCESPKMSQRREMIEILKKKSALRQAYESVFREFVSFEMPLDMRVSSKRGRTQNPYGKNVNPLVDSRYCHHKQALLLSIHRLCKSKRGSSSLATFVVNLLKELLDVPFGNLNWRFNKETRLEFLRQHLGLWRQSPDKEARALSRILEAILYAKELRRSLTELADFARCLAKEKRKGWTHLSSALEAMFDFICYSPTDQKRMDRLLLLKYPEWREEKQYVIADRMNYELGIPRTPKENVRLANPKKDKNSSLRMDTMIYRARKKFKRFHGHDPMRKSLNTRDVPMPSA